MFPVGNPLPLPFSLLAELLEFFFAWYLYPYIFSLSPLSPPLRVPITSGYKPKAAGVGNEAKGFFGQQTTKTGPFVYVMSFIDLTHDSPEVGRAYFGTVGRPVIRENIDI